MGLAYVGYAAALLGAAWIIAERGGLDARARIAFGLGLAALLNPRLMDYDLLLLAPAPVLAAAALRAGAPREVALLWSAVFAASMAALVCNVADLVPLGMHLALPGFAAIVLVAGARLLAGPPSAAAPGGA